MPKENIPAWRRASHFEWVTQYSEVQLRTDQQEEIRDVLDAGIPVMVVGFWQMGKTSLVKTALSSHFSETPNLFIDSRIEGIGIKNPDEFRSVFGKNAISLFVLNLRRNNTFLHQQLAGENINNLRELGSVLWNQQKKITLIIDEAIALVKDERRFSILVNEAVLPSFKPVVVVHYLSRYEDELESLSGTYKPILARPLTDAEVEKLVRRPMPFQVDFSDEAIDSISQFSGGSPRVVNTLCAAVVAREEFNGFVGREDVEVVSRVGSARFFSKFGPIIETFRSIYEQALNPQQQNIMFALASNEEIDRSDEVEKLKQLGLLKQDSAGSLKVNGQLLSYSILTCGRN